MTLQFISTSNNVTRIFDTVCGEWVGYILEREVPKANVFPVSLYGHPHFFIKSFASKSKAIDYAINNLGSHTDDFEDDYSGDSNEAQDYVSKL